MAMFDGRGSKDAAVELSVLRAKLDEVERIANSAELTKAEFAARCTSLQSKVTELESARAEVKGEVTGLRGESPNSLLSSRHTSRLTRSFKESLIGTYRMRMPTQRSSKTPRIRRGNFEAHEAESRPAAGVN